MKIGDIETRYEVGDKVWCAHDLLNSPEKGEVEAIKWDGKAVSNRYLLGLK